jgi:hypothetical protein
MKSMPPTNDNESIHVTLQHVGLSSFVKWQTLAFFIMGVLAGFVYTVWLALAGQITGRGVIWYFLVTTFSYVVLGLISSTILGVIYNSLAPSIGGMRFDIIAHNNPLPPPPPQGWEDALPKINDRNEPLSG